MPRATLPLLLVIATGCAGPVPMAPSEGRPGGQPDWLVALVPGCGDPASPPPPGTPTLRYPRPGFPAVVPRGGALRVRIRLPAPLTPPPGIQQPRALRGWDAGLEGHVPAAPGAADRVRHVLRLDVSQVRPDPDLGPLDYLATIPVPAYAATGVYDLTLNTPTSAGRARAPSSIRIVDPGHRVRVSPTEAGADVLLGGRTGPTGDDPVLRWDPAGAPRVAWLRFGPTEVRRIGAPCPEGEAMRRGEARARRLDPEVDPAWPAADRAEPRAPRMLLPLGWVSGGQGAFLPAVRLGAPDAVPTLAGPAHQTVRRGTPGEAIIRVDPDPPTVLTRTVLEVRRRDGGPLPPGTRTYWALGPVAATAAATDVQVGHTYLEEGTAEVRVWAVEPGGRAHVGRRDLNVRPRSIGCRSAASLPAGGWWAILAVAAWRNTAGGRRVSRSR